MDAAERRCVT